MSFINKLRAKAKVKQSPLQREGVSFADKLQTADGEVKVKEEVPCLGLITRTLPPDTNGISTKALCDLIDVKLNISNARKIAKAMRALGYVPIKSRQFLPGAYTCTAANGWVKPVRWSSKVGRPPKYRYIPKI
jgi:hypothetical protein